MEFQRVLFRFVFFFFNDTATTEIYTLSLHDALPILYNNELPILQQKLGLAADFIQNDWPALKNEITGTLTTVNERSEEHTSELQSPVPISYAVFCLKIKKKKKKIGRENV